VRRNDNSYRQRLVWREQPVTEIIMRLSALDIKKKEFQQKMRDPEEIQAFLNQVSEEVETLAVEKRELEERLMTSEERLGHYLSLESSLEKTLSAAQQTAVRLEEQAKKEAELILREADLERSRKMNDLRIELDHVQSQLIRARSEYQSMIARLRSIMAGFTTYVQSIEQEAAAVSTNSLDVPRQAEFYE
jgi:cell division initiation protein